MSSLVLILIRGLGLFFNNIFSSDPLFVNHADMLLVFNLGLFLLDQILDPDLCLVPSCLGQAVLNLLISFGGNSGIMMPIAFLLK